MWSLNASDTKNWLKANRFLHSFHLIARFKADNQLFVVID